MRARDMLMPPVWRSASVVAQVPSGATWIGCDKWGWSYWLVGGRKIVAKGGAA